MTGIGLVSRVVGAMYGLCSRLLGGGGAVQVGWGGAKQFCCGTCVGWGTEVGAGAVVGAVVAVGAGRVVRVDRGVADGRTEREAVATGRRLLACGPGAGEPGEHALSISVSVAAPARMIPGTTPGVARRTARCLVAWPAARNA